MFVTCSGSAGTPPPPVFPVLLESAFSAQIKAAASRHSSQLSRHLREVANTRGRIMLAKVMDLGRVVYAYPLVVFATLRLVRSA